MNEGRVFRCRRKDEAISDCAMRVLAGASEDDEPLDTSLDEVSQVIACHASVQ